MESDSTNGTNSTNGINGINGIDSTLEELGLGPLPEPCMRKSMFAYLRKDKYGNTTVEALAKEAQLSRTCKAWRAEALGSATMYDAKILFDKNNNEKIGLPRYFVGGVSLGEFAWFPALCIIRHPKNGRVFIVSVKRHRGFEAFGRDYVGPAYTSEQCSDPTFGLDDPMHRFEVNRVYKIGELAGLLNGHCADFNRRLPDLRKFQYADWDSDGYQPLRGRTLVPGLYDALPTDVRDTDQEIYAFTPQKRGETGAQLVTRSVDSTDGRMLTHYGDFITWGVLDRLTTRLMDPPPHRQFRSFLETPTLVLVETDEQEPGAREPLQGWPREAKYMPPNNAWAGPNQTPISVKTGPHEPGALPILLGQLADDGTGAGWWPSIFRDHRCGELEQAYYRKQNGHNKQTAAERKLEEQAKGFPDWHCILTSDETLKKMGEVAMRAHKYMQEVAQSSSCTLVVRPRASRAAKREAEKRIARDSANSDANGRLISSGNDTPQADIDEDAQFAHSDNIPSLANKKMANADPAYVQSKICPFVSDEDDEDDEDEDDKYDDAVEEIVPKKKKTTRSRATPASRASGAVRKRKAADQDPFAAFASLL